jgi:mannosyl-3-phosphoglycerate synthase
MHFPFVHVSSVKDASVRIDTMRFSHILEASDLIDLTQFLARTAFVISHKSESIDTLLGVIWYLPINSPTLIITNCAEHEFPALRAALLERIESNRSVYLVHQKDELIARFFAERGVQAILGANNKVINGKGEGMYIGALMAALLEYPEWIVFYDADNFVPSALLEYTLAMGRLFVQQQLVVATNHGEEVPYLHNVRICWSSKPTTGGPIVPGVLGRCTRTVSPLVTDLIREWFDIQDLAVISSNAGEQGFTMSTMRSLHFSSGYSVETFHMLDLLSHAHAARIQGAQSNVQIHQYQAQSPHFHEKGDESHIKKMISDSLGCFEYFRDKLSTSLQQRIECVYRELDLEYNVPVVYPTVDELLSEETAFPVHHYLLSQPEFAFLEQEAMCG